MPAPIAVLRDIADRGLDPNKAHGRICSDGRLAHPPVHQEQAAPEVHSHKPRVEAVPPAPPREEEVTKPSAEPAPPVEAAEVVDEKVDSAVETEQASPAAKKGPRGKKPAVESQA